MVMGSESKLGYEVKGQEGLIFYIKDTRALSYQKYITLFDIFFQIDLGYCDLLYNKMTSEVKGHEV